MASVMHLETYCFSMTQRPARSFSLTGQLCHRFTAAVLLAASVSQDERGREMANCVLDLHLVEGDRKEHLADVINRGNNPTPDGLDVSPLAAQPDKLTAPSIVVAPLRRFMLDVHHTKESSDLFWSPGMIYDQIEMFNLVSQVMEDVCDARRLRATDITATLHDLVSFYSLARGRGAWIRVIRSD